MKPQYNECMCFIIGLNGCFSVFLSGCKSLQRTSSARTRFLQAFLLVAGYRLHLPFSSDRKVLRPRKVQAVRIRFVRFWYLHRPMLYSWLLMVFRARRALPPADGNSPDYRRPTICGRRFRQLLSRKMAENWMMLCPVLSSWKEVWNRRNYLLCIPDAVLRQYSASGTPEVPVRLR